jgi:hypothetical protein
VVHHRTAVVFKVNKGIRVTMNGVQKNKVSRKAPLKISENRNTNTFSYLSICRSGPGSMVTSKGIWL